MIFSACHSDDSNEPISGSYLPLQIGNYWNFEGNELNSNSKIHREVVALATIENLEYYLVVNSATNGNYSYKDSSYYRVTNDGNVYIYRKNSDGPEDNRFRLNAKDGDTWSYSKGSDGVANITVSVSSLTLNGKEIGNCKSYYFDMQNWADEENTIVLGPGIGFVKEYSDAWGLGYTLKSARINGQDFNF